MNGCILLCNTQRLHSSVHQGTQASITCSIACRVSWICHQKPRRKFLETVDPFNRNFLAVRSCLFVSI